MESRKWKIGEVFRCGKKLEGLYFVMLSFVLSLCHKII